MAGSEDFQALKNISHEVDNSQTKVLISSYCTKAQAHLLNKLRKESARHQELCKFIGSSNFKLEMEIKFAEQEINSLNLAIETIKHGNIELNKEFFLSKESKEEIFQRIQIGKKKYDNLWSESKKRYENIPIVKKLIEVQNKNQTVQANINNMMKESEHLINKIEIKKNDLEAIDRAGIIGLAQFFVRERNKMLLNINENNVKINEVLNEIKMIEKEENKSISTAPNDQILPINLNQTVETIKHSILDNNSSNLNKNTEKDTLMLPKLHLQNNGHDILRIKLDQINKADLQQSTFKNGASSSKLLNLEENTQKLHKIKEGDNGNYISSYFDISGNVEKSNKNYSEKKLVHILKDVKLDNHETYKIIKNLEVTQYQATNYITSKNIDPFENDEEVELNKTMSVQKNNSLEREEIAEIKSGKTGEEDVVEPPSQFLDVTQSSQEKKSVSFNIPMEIEMQTLPEEGGNTQAIETTKSPDKMLNNSTASDESYTTIKDKILKKRRLDLSPQFVYSKSTLMNKQHEEKISKFFETEVRADPVDYINTSDYNENISKNQTLKCQENITNLCEKEIPNMVKDNVTLSIPKAKVHNMEVTGFLFNHGPQGIPDSLDLSMSTTGFEDNEDFPRCIDSSILLSPKADIPPTAPIIHTTEVLSQEVPSFLAGFRKTGLSFFGNATSSNCKPDSNSESQKGGFNFAFGNEEKKGRGGFFNMFH